MRSNFWKKLLTFMTCIMATLGFMCFTSCADGTGSGSGGGNTDKLVLDFNGGTYMGNKTASFTLKEIEYYVGMPIDAALAELGIITTRIYKTGFYFCGWKQNKSSETFIKSLPPYGTLYAIWQSTGNQGGGSGGSTDMQEPIVTFDFNGGTLDGKSSMTFDYDDLKYSMGSSTISVFAFLGLEHPTKSGYTFLGWTSTKNGDDALTTTVPSSGTHTFYAKWSGDASGGSGTGDTGGTGGSSDPDVPPVNPFKLFENGEVIGDFSVVKAVLTDGTETYIYDDEKTLKLVYEGEGIYSTTFTYYDYMCGWDGGDGICFFKIRTVAGGWEGGSYGVGSNNQLVVDGAEVLCDGSPLSYNIKVNLDDGVTYKITFRCASDGNVYVKIATVK